MGDMANFQLQGQSSDRKLAPVNFAKQSDKSPIDEVDAKLQSNIPPTPPAAGTYPATTPIKNTTTAPANFKSTNLESNFPGSPIKGASVGFPPAKIAGDGNLMAHGEGIDASQLSKD